MAGMASQVHPGTSESLEMGVSSVSYHGGKLSTQNEKEMESYRNRMTLEEARWTGVRKKVPGLSGIPKRKSRPPGVSEEEQELDPYQKHINDLRLFVRQHFRQKECARFVPKAGQHTGPKAVKKIKELKCHCGEVLSEHAGMQGPFPHFSSAEMMMDYLIPSELQHIICKERFNEPPPEKFPIVEWKPDSLRPTATCTYGKVNFENVEHAGGKKPAKYIRMTDDDSVDHLITLMTDYWKIMEPEKPNLVISVVGGAKNFKLDGRMRDTFSTGLIKAAKTTSAWLISSGFNMGVMKAVGQAVRQGQSFCWDNDRMAHVLRCIGIAPWGYVKKRRDLESLEGQGKFNANYRTSNVILHDSAVPLNPDHTHFIFVDDGYRIRYGGVAGVRARFEQKISQPESEGGLGIPVVLVIVEGGTDSINDAKKSLEHKIPVVVCAGTGRAADILAYAYTHTKTGSGGARSLKEKHLIKLMDKIYAAYGKNWKEEEIEQKTKDIADSVQICCENSDLLTVFHMNKHEDLDLSILSVLLKAKKGADEAQRLSQLKLALTWDRVDIAQEEIFREDVLWSTGSLDEILTEALLNGKVKFAELILQQGVMMKEYLTVGTLERLYQEVPKHNYLYKVLHKLTGKEALTVENVRILLIHLLDKFDSANDQFLDETDGEDFTKEYMLRRFKQPYKMLLIWALLMNRQDMAKLFWEMGEEPVSSALAATRIYHSLGKNLPRHESNLKSKFQEYEKDFELLATHVLNECHNKDPDKAMMIAERKSPCWNDMTCLQIAAAATDQVFLSSITCQNSITMIWKHGIIAPSYKIWLSVIFPPYIIFALEILNLGEDRFTALQKLGTFYSSPLSKFFHGNFMYAAFLVIYSYMVLVAFEPLCVSPLEWLSIIWVFSFFVDEIHTFIAFPSPTFRSKIRDWYSILKCLDHFNFILAFIGFFIHLVAPQYNSATKVMYCINAFVFFVRILRMYITNGKLGTKIFMIQKMFEELRMFIMVLFVFLLAYGVASQGLLYHTRTPNWVILKDVIYFPYWQLFGEIFLDDIETDNCTAESLDCRTSHWLVPILLAMYLLIGNILLLNLLIAIFSQVFETVEKNSREIQKYQMYFLVMEYENKTALVPPFSLFQHAFLAVRWVVRKCCCHKTKITQHYSKRHLDYLQLFEKEMMMNYLRQIKAEEMSGIENTVNSLQKRVDELTKLIEDEVIADQHPLGMTTMMYRENTMDMFRVPTETDMQKWPSTNRVLRLDKEQKMEPVTEENGEKKKKKHKKHKHKNVEKLHNEASNINIVTNDVLFDVKLNNMNLPPNIVSSPEKPELPDKIVRKNDSELIPAPVFQFQDGSGSDNAAVTPPSPLKRFGKSKFNDEDVMTPRSSRNWTPKRSTTDDFGDEKVSLKPHGGLRLRLSQEKMKKYVSSDDSDENISKKLSKKLSKRKQRNRYASDTE